MKFFADTANVDEIKEIEETGLLDGVTTNPSLILKSGRDILEVIKEICSVTDGPVSAETVSLEADGMIEEGLKLAKIADNIAIKVPLDLERAEGVQAPDRQGPHGQRDAVLLGQPGAVWRPRRGRPSSRPSSDGWTTSIWTGWS